MSGANHELEALNKIDAARHVLEAILTGHWGGSTGVLDETIGLLEAASRHLRDARLERGSS